MSKYCPIIKEPVLYTECLECSEKICLRSVKQYKNNELQNDFNTKPSKNVTSDSLKQ